MRRKPFPGWACDLADLERAEAAGARFLELREQERQRVYVASLHLIRLRGKTFDYGFGPQVCLALDHWSSTRELAEAQDAPEPTGGARQLSLFGGGAR
jgi:hypothetical protein